MKGIYKIKDLVHALDRDKTTILRWEKQGLIPQAKRDSRGWRYYTEDDYHTIVRKVKSSHYFNPRLAAMLMVFVLAINVLAFFALSKYAFSNANLNANMNIGAGTLSVTASSTLTEFSSITYNYTAQTSTASNVASVGVSDARGGAGSWTLNVSCMDSAFDCMWKGGTEMDRFSLHKGATAGSNPSTSGIMCLDLSQNRCVSTGGQPCTSVTTQTSYDCFPSAKTDITFASGSGANGTYWFAETDWAQAAPGLTTASLYTTTLIWDLSRAPEGLMARFR